MFHYVYGGTFDSADEGLAYLHDHDSGATTLNSTWGLIIIHDIVASFDV